MLIRFHLDEHVASQIAIGLRRRGIDVTTTAEAGLIGATDSRQLQYSQSSGRVLVTRDSDLLRLHAQGQPHAGIVYCRQHTASIGEILRGLVLIHDLLLPEEMVGRVEFL